MEAVVYISELESLPFTHDCPVPVTEFQKLSPPQPESCTRCAATVQHCAEFILPNDECLGAVERWTSNAILDFERLSKGERLEGHRQTSTIALGRNCFIPCVRECWFDCRKQEEGVVTALDYQTGLVRSDTENDDDQEAKQFKWAIADSLKVEHSSKVGPRRRRRPASAARPRARRLGRQSSPK